MTLHKSFYFDKDSEPFSVLERSFPLKKENFKTISVQQEATKSRGDPKAALLFI